MDRELTEAERELSIALTIWLRDEMMTRLDRLVPDQDLLWDGAQSNFEYACDALHRVGVFQAEAEYYRILRPIEPEPSLPNEFSRSGLDHLLNALACHASYVTELFQFDQTVVPTSIALLRVCNAMVGCHYMVSPAPNTFEWDDNFGPWLVRHYQWELTDFEPAPLKEVELALAQIPKDAIKQLSGNGESEFVRSFFAQWIDGKWGKDTWREVPNDDWDLDLASGIYGFLNGR